VKDTGTDLAYSRALLAYVAWRKVQPAPLDEEYEDSDVDEDHQEGGEEEGGEEEGDGDDAPELVPVADKGAAAVAASDAPAATAATPTAGTDQAAAEGEGEGEGDEDQDEDGDEFDCPEAITAAEAMAVALGVRCLIA
jgi:hypothetical protein